MNTPHDTTSPCCTGDDVALCAYLGYEVTKQVQHIFISCPEIIVFDKVTLKVEFVEIAQQKAKGLSSLEPDKDQHVTNVKCLTNRFLSRS